MSEELLEESKKHTKKLLINLMRNGKVVDEEGSIFNLEEVGLRTPAKIPLTRVDINDLTDYEIYVDPKDEEIRRLTNIIQQQNEAIQNMAKEKNKKTERKAHVRLSKGRKEELCQYAVDNPTLSNAEIGVHFEVSQSVVGELLDTAKIRIINRRK